MIPTTKSWFRQWSSKGKWRCISGWSTRRASESLSIQRFIKVVLDFPNSCVLTFKVRCLNKKIKIQLLKHTTTECLQYGGDLKLGLNHCEGLAQFRNGNLLSTLLFLLQHLWPIWITEITRRGVRLKLRRHTPTVSQFFFFFVSLLSWMYNKLTYIQISFFHAIIYL